MGKKFRKNKKTIEFDGESLQGYINQLDRSLLQQERIQAVKDLLVVEQDENEYGKFELLNDFLLEALTMEVNDKHIVDVSLTTASNLSDEDTFFVQMQRFANYILYAPDAEKIDKKVIYNFYTEEQFKKELNKEKKFSEFNNKNEEDDNTVEIIDFLIRKRPNFKKEKTIKDLPKGWKDDPELSDVKYYDMAINILKEKIEEFKEILKNNKELEENEIKNLNAKIAKYQSANKLLYNDRIDLYNIIKKPIYLKQIMAESTVIDWTLFDFTDPSQVKVLLSIPDNSIYDDYRDSLILDLNRYIKSAKLTEEQLIIIEMIRRSCKLDNIADILNISTTTVFNRINNIIDKIIYEYQIDNENTQCWFYIKGEYKNCDCCGKPMLISNFRQNEMCEPCYEESLIAKKKCTKCGELKLFEEYGNDIRNKDGLKSSCKKCDSELARKRKLEEMMKSAGIL